MVLRAALLFSLVCALVSGAMVFALGGEGGGAPEDLSFDSGVRAVVWPRAGSGTVLVAVAVAAGSQDEAPGRAGSSHYLEHLLFDGFDGLDERGVTEAFEKLSVYMNAFTREQSTIYFALAPKQEALATARLMAGMLTRSTFEPAVYEKEKKVILEELAKDHSSPTGLEQELMRRTLWKGTPLEHPVGGYEETVRSTPREEVVAYWKTHYVPAAFRVLVSGDLPRKELEEVARVFGELPPRGSEPTRPDPLLWPGWGQYRTVKAPEKKKSAPSSGHGMPSMPGMGHGMGQAADEGGTLTLVVAVPDGLDGAATEILARWLDSDEGPLAKALMPEHALSVSVGRSPFKPRDLVTIEIKASKGADGKELLARTLGVLDAAASGPDDLAVLRLGRAWQAERVLTGQRLHYAAVFYGEALAAAPRSMAEALEPGDIAPEQVRQVARGLLTKDRTRIRAAWMAQGAADLEEPLPEAMAPPPPAAASLLEPGPLGSFHATLPNGLEVGILPETGNDVFGIHLLVADRGYREPRDLPGVADLAHRLLSEGTMLSSSGELTRRLERAGIDVKTADNAMIPFDNRYNVPDFSYVRMEGPAGGLEEALTLLAEMIAEPAWDQAGWKEALRSFKMARKAGKSGGSVAARRLRGLLFGEASPLARPVAGTARDPVPTPEQVKAFQGRWPAGYFSPEHLVLTVASPLPAGETFEVIRDLFSAGPAHSPRRGPYASPEAGSSEPVIELGESPQVTVLFGATMEVAPADMPALSVALDALSDRMVAEIREKKGLAYRLGAGLRVIPGGQWLVSASVGTRPDNYETVVGLVKELMRGLRSEPLAADDLARVTARNRRSRMLRGLSAASRAYRLGRRLFEGPTSPIGIDEEAIARVTPAQALAAAEKYLDPARFTLVVAP